MSGGLRGETGVSSKIPVRWVGVGAAVLIGSAVLAWAAVSHEAPNPDRHLAAATATAPTTNWIVPGDTVAPPNGLTAPQPEQVRKPPVSLPNGPRSQKLIAALKPLLPSGSELRTVVDYPDLNATNVAASTPEGNLVTVAAQRLRQPVPLGRIAHDQKLDTTSETATGSQLVEVRQGMPCTFQIVMARPSGVLVTMTVSSTTAGADIASMSTAGPDATLTLVRDKLDTAAIDALFD